MYASSTAEFIAAPCTRSHGKPPKRRGSWAFQQSTSPNAYDRELMGPIEFFQAR
jgi:hypothetical protein